MSCINFTTRNLLISSLGAFLMCLIASATTPVIFAEESNVEEEPYWGNLKVGDEMCWQWQCPSPMVLYTTEDYKLEILEVRRDRLKVEYYSYMYNEGDPRIEKEERGIATLSSAKLWPLIYPVALMQENEDVEIKTYEYKGSTYIAAYLWVNATEYWWDYSTGILFQIDWCSDDKLVFIEWGLWHTNADHSYFMSRCS